MLSCRCRCSWCCSGCIYDVVDEPKWWGCNSQRLISKRFEPSFHKWSLLKCASIWTKYLKKKLLQQTSKNASAIRIHRKSFALCFCSLEIWVQTNCSHSKMIWMNSDGKEWWMAYKKNSFTSKMRTSHGREQSLVTQHIFDPSFKNTL